MVQRGQIHQAEQILQYAVEQQSTSIEDSRGLPRRRRLVQMRGHQSCWLHKHFGLSEDRT